MTTAVRHLNGMSEATRACLRKAAKCERAAVLATDPGTRDIYRELAGHWREMVEHYEKLDRLRGAGLVEPGRSRRRPDLQEPIVLK